MGNRALVISSDTTKENADKKLGIYLHWHGSEDTVKEMLAECKRRKIRDLISDPTYGMARMCQTFADLITEEALNSKYETARDSAYAVSIGIGIAKDYADVGDNGCYYVDQNFEIVKHTNGSELS